MRGILLSARIFVGLYVGGRPRWRKRDVVEAVKRGWGHEASFISQDGLWTDQGRLKPEKSVQVVILNLDHEGNPIHKTRRYFESSVGRLSEALRKQFRQETVIVDIQANGRTVGTGIASA